MSREGIGIEGYEPGNGFQPAIRGMSRREVYLALLLVAFFVTRHLLRSYLGDHAADAIFYAAIGVFCLAFGIREILNAERWERGKTEKGARAIRIVGIVIVVIGTAVTTLCLRSLVFLWEGW